MRNLNRKKIKKKKSGVVFFEYEKNCTGRLADHDEISMNRKHLKFLASEVLSELRVTLPVTNTTKYRMNSVNLRGAILWNIIP